jgi:predicted acyltransferase
MSQSTVIAMPSPEERAGTKRKSERLLSLDILRGVTIAFMIMVNNNGGDSAWSQMHHAAWNGLTATDLVFPTFLFVVGVSIVFSVQARLKRGESRSTLAWHTVRRTVILILFGIVVNNFPYFHLAHMRFYGVLQRIAICYLIVELFYLFDRRVWTKVALLGVVLAGYWVMVTWVPVPGAGMPGKDVLYLDKDQNIVAWVDRQLMPGHLYEDWDPNNAARFHNVRDPEGLLSDIPAVGTALLGLLTGLWLLRPKSANEKAMGLAAGAAICLAAGFFWSIWFPLNKKMWTSSYVLAAAGWSLTAFVLFYWLVEVRGWGKQGAGKALAWPWLVFGSNAIAAYLVSELMDGVVELSHLKMHYLGKAIDPFDYWNLKLLEWIPAPGWGAFAFSVSYTALCFIPVWLLYRKKIFLKV